MWLLPPENPKFSGLSRRLLGILLHCTRVISSQQAGWLGVRTKGGFASWVLEIRKGNREMSTKLFLYFSC